MALKEFYENFKKYLSDSDFSDCEIIVEANDHHPAKKIKMDICDEAKTIRAREKVKVRKVRNRQAVAASRNVSIHESIDYNFADVNCQLADEADTLETRENFFFRKVRNPVALKAASKSKNMSIDELSECDPLENIIKLEVSDVAGTFEARKNEMLSKIRNRQAVIAIRTSQRNKFSKMRD